MHQKPHNVDLFLHKNQVKAVYKDAFSLLYTIPFPIKPEHTPMHRNHTCSEVESA